MVYRRNAQFMRATALWRGHIVGVPCRYNLTSRAAMNRPLALFALLAACAPAEEDAQKDREPTPEVDCSPVDLATPSNAALTVADASNNFAVDMYNTVASRSEVHDNLFFSPFSISSALGMTLAGAEGETERQMRAVFHVGDDEAGHHQGYGELSEVVFAKPSGCDATVKLANRLFGQTGYPWLDDFLDVTSLDYNAELEERDFAADPDGERSYINDWVAEQTDDRIRDLLPEGAVDTGTRLVLANAIYFDADWDSPFEDRGTQESTFTRSDGSEVSTFMMYQTLRPRTAFVDGIAAVELDYKGGTQSMVLMMPEDPEGDHAPASAVDRDLLGAIEDTLEWSTEVMLGLPRFRFTRETDLKSSLLEMGMVDAFDEGSADFTGMADPATTGDSLFISGAFHKAFIAVDEAGTEAAAATAVGVGTTSVPAFTFIADRPFEFYIRDNPTGTILFMGRVHDPSAR